MKSAIVDRTSNDRAKFNFNENSFFSSFFILTSLLQTECRIKFVFEISIFSSFPRGKKKKRKIVKFVHFVFESRRVSEKIYLRLLFMLFSSFSGNNFINLK